MSRWFPLAGFPFRGDVLYLAPAPFHGVALEQGGAQTRAGYTTRHLDEVEGYMYVYYYRTYEKAVSGGGEREKGGHVLRDTTSRGLYVRVWPPHTSERRGGGGGCEQEGWQGGEGRARMSGQEERQRHIRRC